MGIAIDGSELTSVNFDNILYWTFVRRKTGHILLLLLINILKYTFYISKPLRLYTFYIF